MTGIILTLFSDMELDLQTHLMPLKSDHCLKIIMGTRNEVIITI